MSVTRVSSLVTTNWLKQNLIPTAKKLGASAKVASTPASLRLLDTTWLPEPNFNGYKEFFSRGHIPGAVYFDLKKLSVKRPDSPVDCPIPDSNVFQDYVENLGVSNDTHVVVYDQLDVRGSVRSWFLFRLFGHDKVSILNGGISQWVRDGNDVSTEEPVIKEKSNFEVKFRPHLLLDYRSMLNIVESQSSAVVDTRPDVGGFYITDDNTSGGHMPGARNIPFPKFFNEDGTFKSKEELESLFSAVGVDLSRPVVATCLRGMTACAAIHAAYTLGKEDVPLYNGSWLEWSVVADPKNIVKMKKPENV